MDAPRRREAVQAPKEWPAMAILERERTMLAGLRKGTEDSIWSRESIRKVMSVARERYFSSLPLVEGRARKAEERWVGWRTAKPWEA